MQKNSNKFMTKDVGVQRCFQFNIRIRFLEKQENKE